MIKVQNTDVFFGIVTIILTLSTYLWTGVCPILALWIFIFSLVKLSNTQNTTLVIIQILMLTYSVIPVMYFCMQIQICRYQIYDINQYDNMADVLRIQAIFLVFFLSLLETKSNTHFVDNIIIVRNDIAYYFSLGLMILCYLMVDWRSVFAEVNKVYSIEAAGSSFFYYFVIMGLINYQFSHNKRRKTINLLLSVVLAMLSLLTGKRMATVMIGFLIFILYFSKIMRKRITIIASLILFVGLRLFEQVRLRGEENIKELIGNLFTVSTTIRNNQGDVWYASEVINELIDSGIFDFEFKIKNLIGTIINAFIPAAYTPSEGILNQYIVNNRLFPYPNDGGFISMYGYLWGGYLGVIVVAIFLSKCINYSINSRSSGVSMWSVLVLVSFPRWYAYNPRILMKLSAIYIIVYIVSRVKIIEGQYNKYIRLVNIK